MLPIEAVTDRRAPPRAVALIVEVSCDTTVRPAVVREAEHHRDDGLLVGGRLDIEAVGAVRAEAELAHTFAEVALPA